MEIASATLSIPLIPRSAAPSMSSFSSANSVFFNNGRGTDLMKKSGRNCLVLSRNRDRRDRLGCRCMFGLGMPEIVVIAAVVTLVFGTKKLPEIGRSLGQTVKSFQKAAKEFESELKTEIQVPVEPPLLDKPSVLGEEEKEDVKVPTTVDSI